jgi:ElaB/YqjD/DUF883 family membrane-anchored ribosome-binding protein
MAHGTQGTSDNSKIANDIRDSVSEKIDRMAGDAEQMAQSAIDRGREVGENVQKVAGNLKSAVDTSIKDQPMTTLAVVAVMGFVLGALWKS